MPETIAPNLWFDTEAEQAAEFYVSLFPDARICNVSRYTEAGPREAGTVMTVEWEIGGQRYVGINGGSQFEFDEAVSFQIRCCDQDEVDSYWEKLTADGGQEGQCGWLKDKFGLSWQIIPERLMELMSDRDPAKSRRVMEAMLQMSKIDIAALERAHAG